MTERPAPSEARCDKFTTWGRGCVRPAGHPGQHTTNQWATKPVPPAPSEAEALVERLRAANVECAAIQERLDEAKQQILGLRILNSTNAQRANQAEDIALSYRSDLASLRTEVERLRARLAYAGLAPREAAIIPDHVMDTEELEAVLLRADLDWLTADLVFTAQSLRSRLDLAMRVARALLSTSGVTEDKPENNYEVWAVRRSVIAELKSLDAGTTPE